MLFNFYIIISAFVLVIGLVGVLIHRNIMIVYMCIELILNSINLSLIAFSRYNNLAEGNLLVFFIIAISAAEIAIGLAIMLNIFQKHDSINMPDSALIKK